MIGSSKPCANWASPQVLEMTGRYREPLSEELLNLHSVRSRLRYTLCWLLAVSASNFAQLEHSRTLAMTRILTR